MMRVRKAEPTDYEAIWAIWMQDDVIQWMSFPKQDQEQFRIHYERLSKESEIFVLLNSEEKIVGVRRIKFGKGCYEHIAEYCSMAIDKECRGLGYAKIFYQEFEKIVREKGIKKIQLTQSGGNEVAFHLARDFWEEAMFPNWLYREKEGGHYYLIERYIARFIDNELGKLAPHLPSLKYQEMVPSLICEHPWLVIEKNNDQYNGYINGQCLLKVTVQPDGLVMEHFAFLCIELSTDDYSLELVSGLQKILQTVLQEGRIKKLDLFTSDTLTAKICQEAGFFVRGEKRAARFEEGKYKNEVGLEYSFFNIMEAKKLICSQVNEMEKRIDIENALTRCEKTLASLRDKKICDLLGNIYLENLIYQMVRDELGPNNIYSLNDKRWEPLLTKTPHELCVDLTSLSNRMKGTRIGLFNHAISLKINTGLTHSMDVNLKQLG